MKSQKQENTKKDMEFRDSLIYDEKQDKYISLV